MRVDFLEWPDGENHRVRCFPAAVVECRDGERVCARRHGSQKQLALSGKQLPVLIAPLVAKIVLIRIRTDWFQEEFLKRVGVRG